MLFFGLKYIWFKTIVFAVFAVWSIFVVALMYRDYFVLNPFNPALTGPQILRQNQIGDFQEHSLLVLYQFLFLMAVLLPFSFSRFYWLRLLILQIIFGVLLIVSIMPISGNPGGGVVGLQKLFIFGVNLLIFIFLAAAIVAETVNQRKNKSLQKI